MLDTLKLPESHYLNNGHGLASWLLTKDHKRIAIMYLISISVMFFLGGLFAVGIRLELATPQGDFVSADMYNKFFTMHGVIMVFFFLIPSIPAVLGNFLIPPMIGAKDLAFPRINLLSLYIYWIGGIFTLYAMIAGGVDTGWTFYTPYSATGSNTNVVPTAIGIFIAGFSSILTGLNFIVTIHRMRAPGMTWFRLPLFVWAHYATSLVQVLGTPVIAISVAGGDMQDQTTLNVLLNHIEFGMSAQQAVTAPRFYMNHHQDSFNPDPDRNAAFVGRGELKVQAEIPDVVRTNLSERGHLLEVVYTPIAHPVMIVIDHKTGLMHAAGDPKANRHAGAAK